MSTLRNELRKKLITLDSDYNIICNMDMINEYYATTETHTYNNAPTRKLPKAFKKYKITIDDGEVQQQTNNPTTEVASNGTKTDTTTQQSAGGNKPAENQSQGQTQTQNGQNNNNNNNNNSNGSKEKNFFNKVIEWIKNIFKTLWVNVKNIWNTITGDYKHLQKEGANVNNGQPINVNTANGQVTIPNDSFKKYGDEVEKCSKRTMQLEKDINNLTSQLASINATNELMVEKLNVLKDLFGQLNTVITQSTSAAKTETAKVKASLDAVKKGEIPNMAEQVNAEDRSNAQDITTPIACLTECLEFYAKTGTDLTNSLKDRVNEANNNNIKELNDLKQILSTKLSDLIGIFKRFYVPNYVKQMVEEKIATHVNDVKADGSKNQNMSDCIGWCMVEPNGKSNKNTHDISVLPIAVAFYENNTKCKLIKANKSNDMRNDQANQTQTGNTPPANGQSATGSATATNTTQTS